MVQGHDFKNFPELTNSQMGRYYFSSPHKQIFEDFRCKVVDVHDGDTLRVKWSERDFTFPIRLIDIDAPELDTERGTSSQKWLENQVMGKEIEVLVDPSNRVEKWGRLLGTIFHAGNDINSLSMMLGHSINFEDRPRDTQTT